MELLWRECIGWLLRELRTSATALAVIPVWRSANLAWNNS